MTLGSLFAGIGGFDLGFERAGFKTVWQVEKNAYCRRVLRRHFPDADRRVTDVRYAGARNLLPVDVICGGFPCQDISNAGLRAGIDGARSGLWFHMHRIISELRPRFVVVENVAALLGRGMGRVLGDLSEIGYDAEWQVISAADVGAPHLRERIWLVAYSDSHGCDSSRNVEEGPEGPAFGAACTSSEQRKDSCRSGDVANDSQDGCRQGRSRGSDSSGEGKSKRPLQKCHCECWRCRGGSHCVRCDWKDVADAEHRGRERRNPEGEGTSTTLPSSEGIPDANILTSIRAAIARGECRNWLPEPAVGRVAHGIPARVDRLRALGNAVVPQIPELIARRLTSLDPLGRSSDFDGVAHGGG